MATLLLQNLLNLNRLPVQKYTSKYILLSRLGTNLYASGHYHATTPLRRSGNTLPDDLKTYDPRWLRENCRCPSCFNYSTEQRNILFYELQQNQTKINNTTLDASKKDVTITWADGHVSSFDLDWLAKNTYPYNGTMERKLWSSSNINKDLLDLVPRETFMNDTEGLKRLLKSLLLYGFGIVDGVHPSVDATQQIAERVCFIQETLYGRMWSFTADESRADTAFTNIALGAHTDNTYFASPSGIQIFHCVQHDGDGGKTLLVDGFHAAEKIRADNPKAFDMLFKHRIYHKNKDRDEHYLRGLDPVLKIHPNTQELEMIRYNHYDREPISTIPQAEMSGYYDALEELSTHITDPESEFWIKLKPGMVLFMDNWRVLHGREAFTGLRRICGCYLPRDDWIGKARILHMVQ